MKQYLQLNFIILNGYKQPSTGQTKYKLKKLHNQHQGHLDGLRL